MPREQQKATLLVDGAFLKKYMKRVGMTHSAQTVKQCLYHMIQAIEQQYPNVDLTVNYYGVRAVKNVLKPISGEFYTEPELHDVLVNGSLPGVKFQPFWGKPHYPLDKMWIMKPESYEKTALTDDDFVLNEQPKGVLAQLVDTMAEKAIRCDDSSLFVFGDEKDMAYAMETARAMGMPVHQIALDKNTAMVKQNQKATPFEMFDTTILAEVGEILNRTCGSDDKMEPVLANLRDMDLDPYHDETLLMLDLGCLRKYLSQENRRVSVENMQTLIEQIEARLPDKPTKTILYHATTPRKVFNPKINGYSGSDRTLDKPEFKDPHIMLSWGRVFQSEAYPNILKQDKWRTPHADRTAADFLTNVRQYDVDDRIVFDLALARFNPKIRQVYLLSSDGDFATSVQKAENAGVNVTLLRVEDDVKNLSARLERSAGGVMHLTINLDELQSWLTKEELVHEKNEEEKRARLKKVKERKKLAARLDAEDEEDAYAGFRMSKPSKTERWGRTNIEHKKLSRKIIEKSRNNHHR